MRSIPGTKTQEVPPLLAKLERQLYERNACVGTVVDLHRLGFGSSIRTSRSFGLAHGHGEAYGGICYKTSTSFLIPFMAQVGCGSGLKRFREIERMTLS